VIISAINANGSVSLAAPLTYTHYGSSSLTVNNNYGTIDTRTQVGHVNRNIKIVPGPDAGWGFTVIVYGYSMTITDLTGSVTTQLMGSTQLSGVQIQNGGQLNTINAPLTFINVINSSVVSSVTGTSFLNCKANCIYVQNSRNISITNNVLYEIWTYGA
jgi:hypothetical protein